MPKKKKKYNITTTSNKPDCARVARAMLKFIENVEQIEEMEIEMETEKSKEEIAG